MKRIWKLAAWHWVLVRPTFFLLCGAFGAQQLAVLLIAAARPDAIGHSLATLYAACWQMPLFLLGLAGAFLAASAVGRARTGVTLCTLPGPRWHLPAAQSLLCGLLGLAFTAWQLLLYGVESPLVTAVLARTAAGRVTPALPAASVYPGQIPSGRGAAVPGVTAYRADAAPVRVRQSPAATVPVTGRPSTAWAACTEASISGVNRSPPPLGGTSRSQWARKSSTWPSTATPAPSSPGPSAPAGAGSSTLLSTAPAAKKPAAGYAPGDLVDHKVFGRGKVIKVTPMAGDSLVEIQFDRVGIKKTLANYAPMTKFTET